jgi:hypothetical protein
MVFSSRGRLAYGLLAVVASLATAALSGCGPSKASITGTVTISGQPLPSGTITFTSDAGTKPVKGSAITDGKYTITDFPAGPAKVSVVTTPPPSGAGVPPPGVAAMPLPAGAGTPPGKYVPIPLKYSNPDKSGLTYEVKGGEQTKDFELTR